jgi:DNA-binding LacI/PurR family transcriptional regulator
MAKTLLELADRLEKDMRRRGLVPGSRYFTGDESAEFLGTSVTTANRVLRILADKRVVVRRRNSGTFAGPALAAETCRPIRTLCILKPIADRAAGSLRVDLVVSGVLEHFHDVLDVRISYVPAEDSVEFVRRLLESANLLGELAGIVAISCPHDVYRFLGESGHPFVVMGSLYPDQAFPSVDSDERQAGTLLTKYLMDRGHRRLVVISNSESRHGDSLFHDGVSESLTAAKLPPSSLVLRTPGLNPDVLRAQVKEVLQMPNRPTGFIVKLPRWADDVAAAVKEQGLRVPEDVEIVFKGFAVGELGKSAFPHARPRLTYKEISSIAGEMLSRVRQRVQLDQRQVVVPYELCTDPKVGVVD